jgi:hypothetical protein
VSQDKTRNLEADAHFSVDGTLLSITPLLQRFVVQGFQQRGEKHSVQAAQKDLRGEAGARNRIWLIAYGI